MLLLYPLVTLLCDYLPGLDTSRTPPGPNTETRMVCHQPVPAVDVGEIEIGYVCVCMYFYSDQHKGNTQ